MDCDWGCGRSVSFEVVGEEEIEKDGCETGAANNVDEIMVCEIHCGPIEDTGICPDVTCHGREEVGDEERFDRRTGRMEGGEGTEHDGGV